jgi:hypothetical protein
MTLHFRDFNKDVKELLIKNYSKPGNWSLESKLKGGDIVVNPKADNKGVNVDVEFKCPRGVDVKVNANGNGDIKPNVTYKKDGHKVELAFKALKFAHPGDKAFGAALLAPKLKYEGKAHKVEVEFKKLASSHLSYEGTVGPTAVHYRSTPSDGAELGCATRVSKRYTAGACLRVSKGGVVQPPELGVTYRRNKARQQLSALASSGTLAISAMGYRKVYDRTVKMAALAEYGAKAAKCKAAVHVKWSGKTDVLLSINEACDVAVVVNRKVTKHCRCQLTYDWRWPTRLGIALTLD